MAPQTSKRKIKRINNKCRENGTLSHVNCRNKTYQIFESGKFRKPFEGSITEAAHKFSSHFYMKGKIETPTISGRNYFLTITEECSRSKQPYATNNRRKASELVLNFTTLFEKQIGHYNEKIVHVDHGYELPCAYETAGKKDFEMCKSAVNTQESNILV